jgi:uncharacterized protein YjbJ (UPF0337 family)
MRLRRPAHRVPEHQLRIHVALLKTVKLLMPLDGEERQMSEDRIYGTARNLGGKVEEGAGRITGDARTQVRGKFDQASGSAQDLYGQVSDTARETADNLNDWLRTKIETQPYVTAAVALGIGWLLGRMHRPL